MSAASPPKVLAVIPARLSSRRLPGKALLPLAGRPMIVHVLDRARQVRGLARILVATDDPGIVAAVEAADGEAMLTDPGHVSGTDRVWEVVSRLARDEGVQYDVVVDIQGDEPLLRPAAVEALIEPFADPAVSVATVAAPLTTGLDDPSVVKVVTDHTGDALYFSRSRIPSSGPPLQHIGLYAFRREALARFVGLPAGWLERREKLEQLRALEAGMRIDVALVDTVPLGVDTPPHLEQARRTLASRH